MKNWNQIANGLNLSIPQPELDRISETLNALDRDFERVKSRLPEGPASAIQFSAQAARRGIKGKKNSADLAAPRESVVREFLESREPEGQ
ncbi:MAG: hypothetical protein ACRD7E_08345 [Bryobacteraceae bacterium]